ncbi:MAG: UDP-glucose 4-epimerase [Eubacteriales bacterium SKADARSKE-1]|nr:UDP-glucose 4-epimerase [Eubacteriales bacterium SKADARSKE-1]
MLNVLVTGGAGYIGSHTCVELINNGYNVISVDNYSNSAPQVIDRIKKITGKDMKSYCCDIRNKKDLEKIFSDNKIDVVIHFAGLKSVGESCKKPLLYFDNNIFGTIVLCEVMQKFNVKKLVFSSSATVYGDESLPPYVESMPTGKVTNPYGRTKYIVEEMLKDVFSSDNGWSITLLRYFNPVGAHESGLIGEDPKGIPNNLMPYVSQVAIGKLSKLTVFGGNYNTPDGTCIRDYIHVVDLARGHIKAIEKTMQNQGINIYNLGTSRGYSVLELIKAFEKATGKRISYETGSPREGDIAVVYANTDKAFCELGFKAQFDINKMCEDAWHWQSKNPTGYVIN